MPVGSGYSACPCEACPGGVAPGYSVDVTFTTGSCDNTFPNACANMSGIYIIWTQGPGWCTGESALITNSCGYQYFGLSFTTGKVTLSLVHQSDQPARWEKVFSASQPMDCLAGNTLTLVVGSSRCGLPATVDIVPIAPALSSIGTWECLKRCPCQPLAVPSMGEVKVCCFPNPCAVGSDDCPCGCEPGQGIQITDDCVCIPSACVRCLAGCECKPPKCCKPPEEECGCGGSCGCAGGGDGSCGGGGNGGGASSVWAPGRSGSGGCGCDGGRSCQGCEASMCGG